jgi:hypothetical protein
MKFSKTLCCLVGILTIAFNCHAENLVKNGKLDMVSGKNAPTGWVGDKSTKQLVKTGILATLDQAIQIKVKITKKQHGFFYQFVAPKGGFTKNAVELQGYLKTSIKGGAFLQLKLFKNKKVFKIVNLHCKSAGDWQLVKQVFPIKGADKIQLLCRYLRGQKYLNNTVGFADISLTEVDKKKPKMTISQKRK